MAEQQQQPEFEPMKMISSFLPLIIIWGWGRLNLDTTDPVVLWSIRGVFALSQLIQFALVFLLQQKIKQRSTEPEHAKVIKYVVRKQAKPFATEQDPNAEPFEYVEKAVHEYDLEQTASLKALTPIAITLGIHLYFGAIQPLIIQVFTGPLRLFENKVFKMYFLGSHFDRPFPADPPGFMTTFMGQKSEKEQMDEWDQQQNSKSGKKTKAIEKKVQEQQEKQGKQD